MKIGLLASTKQKQPYASYAKDMYKASPLFSAAYQYTSQTYDRLYVLSAKHYLLHPDEVIEPYDATLNKMPAKERRDWAREVVIRMKERIPMHAVEAIYIHAGQQYWQYLVPLLEQEKYRCFVPIKGMNVGEQQRWYRNQIIP